MTERRLEPTAWSTLGEWPSHYRILQVNPSARQEAVEAAYRRLSVQLRPWAGVSRQVATRLKQIRSAYYVLRDPVSRAAYDRSWGLVNENEQDKLPNSPMALHAPFNGYSRALTRTGTAHDHVINGSVVAFSSNLGWGNYSATRGVRGSFSRSSALAAVVAERERLLPLFPALPLDLGGALASQVELLRALGLMTETSLVFLMMGIGMLAQGLNMFQYPSFILWDEGTYIAEAWAVLRWGKLAHYTYMYGHVPGGWILLAAYMLVTGGPRAFGMPFESGRALMLIMHVAMVPMLYRLARKLGCGAPSAALGVFLFSVSPLAIYYQRIFLLDNEMMFWTLLSLVLLLDSKGRLSRFALSGLFFGLALLSKETDVFLVPAVLYMVWRWRQPHHGRFSVVAWLLPMVSLVSMYPLYAVIKGELVPSGYTLDILGLTIRFSSAPHVSLLGALLWQADRGGGGLFNLQNMYWFNVRNVWMPKDAVLVLGGMAAVAINLLLGIRSHRILAASLLGLMPLAYMARGGIVFQHYILFAIPFFCLNLAMLASFVLNRLPTHYASLLSVTAALFLFGHYWQTGALQPLYTVQASETGREAIVWVKEHLPPQSVIISQDNFWTDLHEPGLGGGVFPYIEDHEQVVSNPAVQYGVFHNDWRTTDYLLMRPQMYELFRATDNTVALGAYDNSCLVKEWVGPDGHRIQVWKVDKTGKSKGKPFSADPYCAGKRPTTEPAQPQTNPLHEMVPSGPNAIVQAMEPQPQTKPNQTKAPAKPNGGARGVAPLRPTPVAVATTPVVPNAGDRSVAPLAPTEVGQATAEPTSIGLPNPTPEPSPVPAGALLPQVYLVRPGDTLTGIAERVYGDAADWQAIAKANEGKIPDPNSISPGQKLLIPPRGE